MRKNLKNLAGIIQLITQLVIIGILLEVIINDRRYTIQDVEDTYLEAYKKGVLKGGDIVTSTIDSLYHLIPREVK